MFRIRLALTLALAAATCLPLAAQAQADKATINAIEGYFDFADANAGTNSDTRSMYVLEWRPQSAIVD